MIAEGQKQHIIKDLEISIILQILYGIIISIAKGYSAAKLDLDEIKKRQVINSCWDSIKA